MTNVRLENGKRVVQRWDDVFDAVSAEPRRQLIVSLADRSETESVPLPESAVNPNVPPDPDALRRDLMHTHLPLLADHEFIEWETDPFVASRGQRFDEVAVVFDALQRSAQDVPDSLVMGCQRLEREQQLRLEDGCEPHQ